MIEDLEEIHVYASDPLVVKYMLWETLDLSFLWSLFEVDYLI
ncbi:hypothetical protein FHS14_004857 [Paenibacillus baekrokdamisoli]|nr:hypothetical protein [Paenibacillus baekrokdamisoli]